MPSIPVAVALNTGKGILRILPERIEDAYPVTCEQFRRILFRDDLNSRAGEHAACTVFFDSFDPSCATRIFFIVLSLSFFAAIISRPSQSAFYFF